VVLRSHDGPHYDSLAFEFFIRDYDFTHVSSSPHSAKATDISSVTSKQQRPHSTKLKLPTQILTLL